MAKSLKNEPLVIRQLSFNDSIIPQFLSTRICGYRLQRTATIKPGIIKQNVPTAIKKPYTADAISFLITMKIGPNKRL